MFSTSLLFHRKPNAHKRKTLIFFYPFLFCPPTNQNPNDLIMNIPHNSLVRGVAAPHCHKAWFAKHKFLHNSSSGMISLTCPNTWFMITVGNPPTDGPFSMEN